MPAATSGSKNPVKRKRDTKGADPRKRQRSESVSSSGNDEEPRLQDRILLLEKEILESKKNYNNIVVLIDLARTEAENGNEEDDDDNEEASSELTASVSLCRVFLRLLAAGHLTGSKSAGEKERVVAGWLRERLAEYEDVLLDMFSRSGDLASTALTLVMRLLQAEGRYLHASQDETTETSGKSGKGGKGGKGGNNGKAGKSSSSKKGEEASTSTGTYYFPQALLRRLVRGLVLARQRLGAEVGEALADEFVEKYVGEYHDVRFYTFKAVAALLGSGQDSVDDTAEGAFYLLSLIDDVPEAIEAEGADGFYAGPTASTAPKSGHQLRSMAQHKKQAQDAWIGLLGRGGSAEREVRKRALGVMETVIAPWFVRPELLLDYLTDCYNAGGATSLLALSGLYYLIRERNVDYPAFYAKLYSLLDGDMLHSRHRSRFFRLMDTFLASTHLPSQLVASFVKRLARLCLTAPPSAIVTVVPWIYNTFRKHPLCTFMIHRVPRSPAERDQLEREGMADPFLPDEADPMETRAINSCLWEIVQLQSHYHPNVATIAKIISEQFTKQSYNIEDFLDHSYQSLFDAEIGKEVKKTPVVEFQIPKRIFFPQDPAAGVEDGILVKLWDFS